MSNILMVLSAADTWTRADGSKYASGVWAEEFVVMHEKLVQAGCKVDIATPEGRAPTIDPHSLEPALAGSDLDHFKAYLRSVSGSLAAPLRLSDVSVAGYDVVAIPGGHGPVEDLYRDPDMGRILGAAEAAGRIIASVCHGPAALLSASTPDGWWPFAGRRMTAFSDEEEVAFGTADNAPWLLATRLKELGARYERGPQWQAYVVRDGNLITGQNPASTGPLAEAVLEALRGA
jgi:putative intracellular protease/amidase